MIMFECERKAIDWLNRYIIYIAVFLVVFSAAWMRMGGRNYVGNDFHFSLYDIPGNCNSLLYRTVAGFLMKNPDRAVNYLKYLSYAGDFATAFFALLLLRRKGQRVNELRTFFILTALLLSPVSLLYSVSGMKIDSVCMSLLLLGTLCFQKGLVPLSFAVVSLSAFVYPAYWPVAIVLCLYLTVREIKLRGISPRIVVGLLLLAGCLCLSFFIENAGDANYFWGKIFVTVPATGENFRNPWKWFLRMCSIYGYFFATGSLLAALKNKKYRLPALTLQLLVIMYIGWQQTSMLAFK